MLITLLKDSLRRVSGILTKKQGPLHIPSGKVRFAMTSEILAKNKGWLYLFLTKSLSEPKASELFCALQKPAAFCVKKFLRKRKSNFSLPLRKLSQQYNFQISNYGHKALHYKFQITGTSPYTTKINPLHKIYQNSLQLSRKK